MPIRPHLDGATIQERYDGVNHGDPIQPCRISTFGESPSAMVTARQWVGNEDGTGGEFVDVDRLTEVVIHDDGGRTFTLTGISERLQFENKLPADQAQIEWIITAGRCEGCL